MAAARFGRYRLERLLGKGGMGQVWLAYDTTDRRRVALKLLPADLAADAVYRTRFEREAQVAAALRDPHIVPIHRHGAVDGRLFIEMAFVEGTDLAARLTESGPLEASTALHILGQVAAALDAAHRAGLVHRDVKPSNILVAPDGFTYLIDFGIARGAGQTSVTTTGLAIGTWAYMAPERFSGHADARADVYSLACVLYESLTGRRPYGDTDPAQQMRGHLMSDPPCASSVNPTVPAALDAVIARGMAKEPGDRFASAGEFVCAARAVVSPGAPQPTRVLEQPGLPPTRVETRGAVAPAGGYAAAGNAGQGAAQPVSNGAAADHGSAASVSPGKDAAVAAGYSSAPPMSEGAAAQHGSPGSATPSARSAAALAVGSPVAAGGQSPAAGVPKPTEVMPVPGPTPTLVQTRVAPPGVVPVGSAPQNSPSALARGGVASGVPPQNPAGALAPAAPGVAPQGLAPLGYAPPASAPGAPVVHPYGKRWYLRRKSAPVVRRPKSLGPVWPSRGPAYVAPPRQPVPRRRRGGVLRKVIGALVVIFLAPFVFAAGCLALIAAVSGNETTAPPPTAMVEENPEPAPNPLDVPAPAYSPVRDGKFEFAVTDVRSGVARVGLQSARGAFLVVTLAVRNISDETKWFLPFGQKLFDAQGNAIDHDTTATAWQAMQSRLGHSFELRPGASATTVLVFDVPPDSTPAHLELHDFVLSDGVTVALD
ncbi:protein kinase [Nocardia amikacinitolerans]|uniref:protein kinase domain-containing protein n=1 Tax=Nocardia amikacinitolerans TaxID=756689 RepID=UPI0036CE57C7